MKHYLTFDAEQCCACHACAVACMDQNDTDPAAGQLALRKAYNVELKDSGQLECVYISAACQHCVDAPCVLACPCGCLSKDAETGMTIYDNQNCIGCRSCGMACPFGAPRYQPDGKMEKCDGCYLRIKNGLQPACVRACCFGALDCLSEEEYQKQNSDKAFNALVKTVYKMK